MKTEFSLEARKRLAGDRHRPLYHFLPPANWMNDPNGLMWWKGSYHLFYQHNLEKPDWGLMHWGHASSEDLVHWEDMPLALRPTPGGPDQSGVWTGCGVDDHGVPSLVYTGRNGERETVCLATSRDEMLTWEKDPANPIIPNAPPGLNLTDFRDPFIWTEGGSQYLVIGGGVKGKGGAALLYRALNLHTWEYLGPMLAAETQEFGTVWECPNFFSSEGKHCLIISAGGQGRALYFTGSFDGNRLIPEASGEVDSGGYCYAPQLFVDKHQDNQRIVSMGWAWEGRSLEARMKAGWAGVMTLPRVLSIDKSGKLVSQPAPEIQSLRKDHTSIPDLALSAGEEFSLPLQGDCLEIKTEIDGNACIAGLKVFCAPDGSEETLLTWDNIAGNLTIDREKSSLSEEVIRDKRSAIIEADRIALQVFLDRSILEVYANGTCCLTSRVYPSRKDSSGVRLFCQQGKANFTSSEGWKMAPVWPVDTE